MTIQCMLDNKEYTNKPNGYETGGIQKRLKAVKININELSIKLSKGCTFKPALLNSTKSTGWVSQQLFALDFDGGTTIEYELNRCKELNILPAFGYTSFTHTKNKHKFRLVFCTESPITDIEIRNKLQIILIKTFYNSDSVTKDPTRMFYGGKTIIECNINNKINIDYIIDNFYKDIYHEEIEDLNQKMSSGSTSNSITPMDRRVLRKGVTDKEYINNTLLSVTPKTPSTQTHMTLRIEAIKALKIDLLKTILSTNSINEIVFNTENDLYKHINSIDLGDFLGIDGKVNCIFPEHNDSSPSATIFTTNDGTQIYKCFGCNKALTIISVVEKLAKCKRREAIEFIKSVYNIKLAKTEWQKEQIQAMIDNVNYLDSEDFNIAFPNLANLIRTRKHHIQKILIHFTQYVSEDFQYNNKPIFFSDYNTLLNVCGINPNKRITLSQSLILFALLNMIIKLKDHQIPCELLSKAKHIAAKHNHKKLTNFYSFDDYGLNLLEECEEIAIQLKDNNISIKGLSREYVLRTFGIDVANKVFPQYIYENERGTTKKQNDDTVKIANKILKHIEKYGYIKESDISKDKKMELQWKKSIQEILDSYDLQRIRLNNKIKEYYNINVKGYPFIITKNNK